MHLVAELRINVIWRLVGANLQQKSFETKKSEG